MSIEKIKQKLIQNSIKDSSWLEKARWRQENEYWLDVSFSIAVKIASVLSANKKANEYPKSQVELARAMGCSAQYVNKLLRGEENLQIETICKVQRILGIKLIEVPKGIITEAVRYQSAAFSLEPCNIKSSKIKSSKTFTTINYSKKSSNFNVVDNYEIA